MPRIGLIIVLLLGLVISTPVVCVCGPADHGGQALHSLLPHTHEHPHDLADEPLGAERAAVADAFGADVRAPGVTAQTGTGAVASSITGAIGPAMEDAVDARTGFG